MLLNKNNKTIYCFYCNKEYNIYTEIFISFLFEESITCPQDHLIGNVNDLEWIEFFSECPFLILECNKLRCKCVDDLTDCEGNEKDCNYPIGKKSYEDDIKEGIKC
jgi:hypothetical protein